MPLYEAAELRWTAANGAFLRGARDPAAVRHDAELAGQLQGQGALPLLELRDTAQGPVAAYDDPGAVLLETLVANGSPPLALPRAMAMAVAIARALHQVHAAGVVHGQLHPATIFVAPDGSQAWLAGFDQATRLDELTRELQAPERLPFRLGWISPEQTGRMNRAVDYRSDYYSLGVTLFQLLTGRLPLRGSDAMAWVHAHIAARPPLAHEVDPRVPLPLGRLLDRLLEKNAEARYQSTVGILADLERCAAGIEAGQLADFELGTQDRSERFTLTARLYGREAELTTLMRSFERAADDGPAGLVLVSGWSGIGKSALLYEVHRPLTERYGSFLAGKSEPHTRTIPYHSLLQAFRSHCRRLLTWSEQRVGVIRRKVAQAIAPNGQVLVDVMPELGLVLGAQPDVAEVGSVESRNRFNHTFLRFVQAMAAPEHPLLLFLDDLQWIDKASLEFIDQLLTSEDTRNLLLLGAYRSNEVGEGHPLAMALPAWEEAGVPIQRLSLEPLRKPDLRQWLADVTLASGSELDEFTSLVLEKTGANPFFVRAFLQELHAQGLIRYGHDIARWTWDISELQGKGFTDNVVQHMAARIERLAEPTRRALAHAAALGATFDLAELTTALSQSVADTADAIWAAAQHKLVVPLGDTRGAQAAVEAVNEDRPVGFRFVHDRIQEAAYLGIEEAQRPALHLALARQLHNQATDAIRVFAVASHYLRCAPLVQDRDEQLAVANLMAGAAHRAGRAGAHDAAQRYLRLGVELLGDGWADHYPLALDLHSRLAQVDYLQGDKQHGDEMADLVLANARSAQDKLSVHEARVLSLSGEMRLLESVQYSIRVAAEHDVDVQALTTPEQIGGAMGRIAQAMDGRSFMDLVDLPPTDDPVVVQIVRMLYSSLPAAAMAAPEFYGGMLVAGLELVLDRGLTPDASGLVASYGLFLQLAGMHDAAYETGLAASAMHNLPGHYSGGVVEFGVFVKPWKDPLKDSMTYLRAGAHRFLEQGHQTNWGYSVNQATKFAFLAGMPLSDIDRDYESDWQALTRRKQFNSRGSLELWGQAVSCLRGQAPDPSRLEGDRFSGDTMLPIFVDANVGTLIQYTVAVQTMLAYLFGDVDRALATGFAHDALAGGGPNSIAQPEVTRVWFRALAGLAAAQPDLERVTADRARLAAWAEQMPVNNAHRLALFDAELARVQGEELEAMAAYDQAIALSRRHPFIQDEALASELAAAFHMGADREGVGRVYLDRAVECWRQWGAQAKVDQLSLRYGLVQDEATDASALDLATVLKAAAAINSEIVLDRLLVKIMAILVENAGARRGALILRRGGRLALMALQHSGQQAAEVFDGVPLSDRDDLPTGILRFCARTRKLVLLADARSDDVYGGGEVIRRFGLRSVLCIPLLRQGELSGLLYLDNDLAADAFTPQRVALLQALSGQVAIAVENASLYADLEDQAHAFSRFVPQQFLSNLGRESIRDVQLGDAVRRDMGVLFSDIRGFTSLSESMSPEDNFRFLNAYLQRVGPVIRQHQGFVDKFIGDAVMALFPGSPDDVLNAATDMQRAVTAFNLEASHELRIGIGLHHGSLMLGVLGDAARMDSTVISDAVNLGARLEGLCKDYGVGILASEQLLSTCTNPDAYPHRSLGQVEVRGRAEPVRIYELFGHESEETIAAKLATRAPFEEAVQLLGQGAGADAFVLLRQVQKQLPGDAATAKLLREAAAAFTT